jgi:hypothetical protein
MDSKQIDQKGTSHGLLEYLCDPSLVLNYGPKYLHHSTRERIGRLSPAFIFLRAYSMG